MQTEAANLLASLSGDSRADILRIYKTLEAAGHECYLVGGNVRDLLLGRQAGDADFATSARPEQTQALFRRVIPTGIKHGTVSVLFGKRSYEVTTYRSEAGYSDARHPDTIRFSRSLSEDLLRRDFTINAFAYEPGRGLLIDEHGGMNDLKERCIRAIGSPQERFQEDGLRPIRACRLAAALEFGIERETKVAMQQPKVQQRSAMIAIERFTEELWKGFRARKVSMMIRSLEESGLLALFLKEIPDNSDNSGSSDSSDNSSKRATSEICLEELDNLFPAVRSLRLAHWWQHLGIACEAQVQRQGRALRLATKDIQLIAQFLRYFQFQRHISRQRIASHASEHSRSNPSEQSAKHSGSSSSERSAERYRSSFSDRSKYPRADREYLYQIRRYLSSVKQMLGPRAELFLRYAAPYPYDISIPASRLVDIYGCSPLVAGDLKIRGNDLIQLGLKGPRIGAMLAELLDAVLRDPSLNQKERLIELAREKLLLQS